MSDKIQIKDCPRPDDESAEGWRLLRQCSEATGHPLPGHPSIVEEVRELRRQRDEARAQAEGYHDLLGRESEESAVALARLTRERDESVATAATLRRERCLAVERATEAEATLEYWRELYDATKPLLDEAREEIVEWACAIDGLAESRNEARKLADDYHDLLGRESEESAVALAKLERERDEARADAALMLQVLTSVAHVLGVDANALAEDPSLAVAERDEARAVLREARVWISDACDLISTCIPDSSSWMDDGGLADRSDDLEERASWACGDWTDDPTRALGERE
jgi:hypothetical protein